MAKSPDRALRLNLRGLEEAEAGMDHWRVFYHQTEWEPARTAVVICDMWDKHWCKSAMARVAEMAPHMNTVISQLRQRGLLIIHCPSETMNYYQGAPGRILAQSAPKAEPRIPFLVWRGLDTNRESSLPIDDSGGSCDHELRCHGKALWRHEIDSIEIAEGDAITDNSEAYNLMRQRGVTNVIVMGVHLNLCVLGRPFSIRQMVAQGQNVVLMRDLTDCLHNTRRKPYVDHFTANDLMTWHIEKYWCPSITSDQIIGGRQFRFAADPNSAMRKGATVLTV